MGFALQIMNFCANLWPISGSNHPFKPIPAFQSDVRNVEILDILGIIEHHFKHKNASNIPNWPQPPFKSKKST